MKNEATNLKVLKRLSPSQAGAIKLARRYGDALVCVRHRTDEEGLSRITTVELIAERTPIQPRTDKIIGVKINFGEPQLQSVAKAAGATWDRQAKLWRMPKRVATALNLEQRIREE
jgi:hypothetical protein